MRDQIVTQAEGGEEVLRTTGLGSRTNSRCGRRSSRPATSRLSH